MSAFCLELVCGIRTHFNQNKDFQMILKCAGFFNVRGPEVAHYGAAERTSEDPSHRVLAYE